MYLLWLPSFSFTFCVEKEKKYKSQLKTCEDEAEQLKRHLTLAQKANQNRIKEITQLQEDLQRTHNEHSEGLRVLEEQRITWERHTSDVQQNLDRLREDSLDLQTVLHKLCDAADACHRDHFHRNSQAKEAARNLWNQSAIGRRLFRQIELPKSYVADADNLSVSSYAKQPQGQLRARTVTPARSEPYYSDDE